MGDLSFSRMLDLQRALQERYKGKWAEICPAEGRNKFLWMLGEAGEVVDILKEKKDEDIMKPGEHGSILSRKCAMC